MHSQNAESMFGFIPFKSLHLNEKKKYKKKNKIEKAFGLKKESKRILAKKQNGGFSWKYTSAILPCTPKKPHAVIKNPFC